ATLTRLRRLRTPHGRDRPARQRRPGLTTRTPTSEVTTLTRSPASAPSTTPYPTGVSRPHPYGFTIAHHPVKDGNRHDDGLVPGTHPGFRAAPRCRNPWLRRPHAQGQERGRRGVRPIPHRW